MNINLLGQDISHFQGKVNILNWLLTLIMGARSPKRSKPKVYPCDIFWEAGWGMEIMPMAHEKSNFSENY